jgi:hypothetical protein
MVFLSSSIQVSLFVFCNLIFCITLDYLIFDGFLIPQYLFTPPPFFFSCCGFVLKDSLEIWVFSDPFGWFFSPPSDPHLLFLLIRPSLYSSCLLSLSTCLRACYSHIPLGNYGVVELGFEVSVYVAILLVNDRILLHSCLALSISFLYPHPDFKANCFLTQNLYLLELVMFL